MARSRSLVQASAAPEGELFVGGLRAPLPTHWQDDLVGAIRQHARVVWVDGSHESSRETDMPARGLPTITARGTNLLESVPWLWSFYTGPLFNLVRQVDDLSKHHPEEGIYLVNAAKPTFTDAVVVGNVLFPGMRFERHVDTWPVGANLYIRGGGSLVIQSSPGVQMSAGIVARDPSVAISAAPGTISVVRARGVVHGVPWSSLSHPLPEAWEPDLGDDASWAGARISLNFNFGTPRFFGMLDRGEVELPQAYTLGYRAGPSGPQSRGARRGSRVPTGEVPRRARSAGLASHAGIV